MSITPTFQYCIIPSWIRPCLLAILAVFIRELCRETVLEQIVGQIIIWALPVLVAVVFHEVAHGWVAYRLGDPTAARLGRLTLNPFAHVDLFGTILVPLMLIIANSPFVFGYAKPVPVNFDNLRHPKRDMIWVAAAGPATNLVLAAVCTAAWRLLAPMTGAHGAPISASGLVDFFAPVVLMAQSGILINVTLAVFNMLPLPPLDGGRVLVGLLPHSLSLQIARIEPFGFLILIVLLMTRTLDRIIDPPTEFLLKLYLGVF
jgi:Zn-dependent protease